MKRLKVDTNKDQTSPYDEDWNLYRDELEKLYIEKYINIEKLETFNHNGVIRKLRFKIKNEFFTYDLVRVFFNQEYIHKYNSIKCIEKNKIKIIFNSDIEKVYIDLTANDFLGIDNEILDLFMNMKCMNDFTYRKAYNIFFDKNFNKSKKTT